MKGLQSSTLRLSRLVVQQRRYMAINRSLNSLAGARTWTTKPQYPSSVTCSIRSLSTSSTKKKDDSNIFLDNLGSIFLGTIGIIIASLVRSYYGTQNRNQVRNEIETSSVLDPLELDDLRRANSEFTLQIFDQVLQDIHNAFPDGQEQATYSDFIQTVRQSLARQNRHASLELGHLLDRVVLGALQQQNTTTDQPQSLVFWCTVLSMALNAPVIDRIQVLYKILQMHHSHVTIQEVRQMVQYLQDTCQLVPDTQVVLADRKYPTQQYQRGQPHQLVEWEEGRSTDPVDVDAFGDILRSKSVCAWGECYHKKKGV